MIEQKGAGTKKFSEEISLGQSHTTPARGTELCQKILVTATLSSVKKKKKASRLIDTHGNHGRVWKILKTIIYIYISHLIYQFHISHFLITVKYK